MDDVCLKSDPFFGLKIPGTPQQRGSKSPKIIRRPGSRSGLGVVCPDSNLKSKSYMQMVSLRAKEAVAKPPTSKPVVVSIQFYFRRPKSHFRANGDLKPSSPIKHVQTPDLAKLVRCLEDALTGIVWQDDKQVVCYLNTFKDWASDGHPFSRITVWEIS